MEEAAPQRPSRTAFAARFFNQLHQFKRLLFRYWWIPLLTFGASEGVQWLMLKRIPPAFVSVGKMIVNVKLSIPNANVYSEDMNNFFGTQTALMQSDSVINRVNARLRSAHPELAPVPVDISVSLSPKSGIFNLRATGREADYTQAYLKATMDEYINLKRDLLANASTATQSSMEEELKQMAVDLQKSKTELLNYQSSNNAVLLRPNGGNDAADYLSYLTRQLAERRSELLTSKALSLDENLERQQGIFAPQGSVPQPVKPNTGQEQGAPPPPGVVMQPSQTSASQVNSVPTPANNDPTLNNTPSSLGGFEEQYLQTKQRIFLLSGGNTAANYLASLTCQLAERNSELQLLKKLTLDENLERQQGVFAPLGSVPQPVKQNTVQKPGAPRPPGGVTQPGQASASQANTVPTPTNSDAPLNNTPSSLGGFEEQYLQTKQQIILLKARRDELTKLGLASKAYQMVDIDQEIANHEKRLEIFQEQSQEQLKNRQHTLEVQIQDLDDQVKDWEAKALDASRKLSVFEALKESHQRLQTSYDQLQANVQTLNLNKGIGQESVTLFEPPTRAVPVPQETRKHLIMAGLIGLALGIGIVVFSDRLDDRPHSLAELEELISLPVLGQIPLVKAKNRKAGVPVLQLEDERYPLIEAYRSLRSALLYKNSLAEQPKSIVISSALPHDGKSMVSANFAITLAQTGARVLLIDADLRRGVLHHHFSMPASPGLAEVLGGQCAWSTAVVQTSLANLSVLPCGTYPRHPGNLFAMAEKFLAETAGHYDYYLFDTAPVMVGDDVLSLAPHVDGLLMVVRAGHTSGRVAQAALDLLRSRGVNVLGLVFNAVHPKTSDYYNYRYKEYYPQHLMT